MATNKNEVQEYYTVTYVECVEDSKANIGSKLSRQIWSGFDLLEALTQAHKQLENGEFTTGKTYKCVIRIGYLNSSMLGDDVYLLSTVDRKTIVATSLLDGDHAE